MESRPAAREVSPQTVLSARKARVQHENKHEYVVESFPFSTSSAHDAHKLRDRPEHDLGQETISRGARVVSGESVSKSHPLNFSYVLTVFHLRNDRI